MAYCDWPHGNEIGQRYHDEEWGVPVHDDRVMFEHLMLECLQCGLSWGLMLRKRDIFREVFAGFDYDAVAAFTEANVERIVAVPGMLRAPRKVRAVIANAKAFCLVRAEFGTFCDYLWGFTGGKAIVYAGHDGGRIPVSNGLSARISEDLRRRGFSYVGPVTVYSALQAMGLICDHDAACPCRARILANTPWVELPPDEEQGVHFFGEGPLVRRAGAEDLDTLTAFASALWPDAEPAELRDEFARLLPSPEAALLVVEHSGGPVGFAHCQLRHDYVGGCSTSPVGYLEGIYVIPEARRLGCARALVAACEAWARSLGCTEFGSDCDLDNNVSAAFHAALGFAEANRIICFAKKL